MLSFKECQMRHKFGYIYSFTNLINDKRYIGLTTNPELRKSRHIEYSKDINCQAPLYRAIRKYGLENFKFEIIEHDVPIELLSEREKFWIKEFDSMNNGYNSTPGGEGGNTYAKKTSEEMEIIGRKISEALKGSNNGNHGQYVGSRNAMYNVIPHNKFIYLKDIKTNKLVMMRASEIKLMFNIDKYRTLTKYARSGIILNDRYLIIESVSTDGDECSHVGLEISTNSKRNAR